MSCGGGGTGRWTSVPRAARRWSSSRQRLRHRAPRPPDAGGGRPAGPRVHEGLCTQTEFVILTAVDDVQTAVKALRLGAYDYLVKPIDNQRLFLSIERAFERKGLRACGRTGPTSMPPREALMRSPTHSRRTRT
ncbi:MAG: hypothetical protein MZV64_31890 [Ignavibacteriales bacterium]|nr:hypothetical protein [Ignavibacteriales bacterium]